MINPYETPNLESFANAQPPRPATPEQAKLLESAWFSVFMMYCMVAMAIIGFFGPNDLALFVAFVLGCVIYLVKRIKSLS